MNIINNAGVCQGFDLDLNKANIVNFPWLSPTGTIDLNDAEPQCDDAANDDNPVWERLDFGSINAAAAARGRDLVQQWLPGGRLCGSEYLALNPRRADNHLGSFSVNISTGAYYDHASGDGGGDFVALYAFVRRIDRQSDAARALAAELGMCGGFGAFSGPSSGVGGWRPLPKAATALTAPARPGRTPDVHLTKSRSQPAAGTLAETYLRGRSLMLPATDDILFNPDATDYAEKRGYPAMVSVIRFGDGTETGGLHITYLNDDGSKSHKKMLGTAKGGAVRLAPIGDDGVLGVSEGIETGIAAMMMYPDVPVWAALSTSGMKAFQIPSGCKRLVIFADAGEAGQAAASELSTAAERAGVAAIIVRPQSDDDFAKDVALGLQPEPLPEPAEIFCPASPASLIDRARTIESGDTEALKALLRDVAASKLETVDETAITGILKARKIMGVMDSKKAIAEHRRALKLPRTYAQLPVLDDSGMPLHVLANVSEMMRQTPALADAIAFDEFKGRAVAVAPLPWNRSAPRNWESEDDIRLLEWLDLNGLHVHIQVVQMAVEIVGRERMFHPVRDYLDSLVWDGTERIGAWLSDRLGAAQSAYTSAVGRKWLLSAVARVMQPGCKADCALILEGAQGARKSTALRVLSEPWFTDEIAELGTKDAAIQVQGAWIIEIAELDGMKRGDVDSVKAFISRQTDRFRPPYGARLIEAPRQCVFAGSVNGDDYLADDTGNRRFWPVLVGRIDIDALHHDRDQLWAEAVACWRAGEKWWLDDAALIAAATEEQAARQKSDAWLEPIADFMQCRPYMQTTTVAHVLESALEMEKGQWRRDAEMRVAAILKSLGWKPRKINGVRTYERPDLGATWTT